MLNFQHNRVASTIIGAAIEVHRCLGPGLMESVYQTCMAHELRQRGLQLETEVSVPVMFKGIRMERGFRLDLLVDADVIVEVKCVERLLPIHIAQVLTYLKLTGARQVRPGTLVPIEDAKGPPLPSRDQDSRNEGSEDPWQRRT